MHVVPCFNITVLCYLNEDVANVAWFAVHVVPCLTCKNQEQKDPKGPPKGGSKQSVQFMETQIFELGVHSYFSDNFREFLFHTILSDHKVTCPAVYISDVRAHF